MEGARVPSPRPWTVSSPGWFLSHTLLCQGPPYQPPSRLVTASSVGGTLTFESLPRCVKGMRPAAEAWGTPAPPHQKERAAPHPLGVGRRTLARLLGKQARITSRAILEMLHESPRGHPSPLSQQGPVAPTRERPRAARGSLVDVAPSSQGPADPSPQPPSCWPYLVQGLRRKGCQAAEE